MLFENINEYDPRKGREKHYRAFLSTQGRYVGYAEYIKVRDTPKGIVVVSIDYIYTYDRLLEDGIKQSAKELEKLVLHDTMNKWCYPTKEKAFEALIKRSEVRKRHLERQLSAVNDLLNDELDKITDIKYFFS